MTVWIERIGNAHTHTYTFIKIDDPRFSFSLFLFLFLLSLSLFCFDQRDLIDKHTYSKRKKKREKIAMTISGMRNSLSLVWLLSAYLMFYLIYWRWIFYTICQEGQRERERQKKRRENATEKAIKNCCLAWKMLLIDVM
jgi:hypothetical protein